MQAYYVETMVSSNRTLTIKGLPFLAGDKVQVIVRHRKRERERRRRYPLRGKPIRYVDPCGSVAESDWETLEFVTSDGRLVKYPHVETIA